VTFLAGIPGRSQGLGTDGIFIELEDLIIGLFESL